MLAQGLPITTAIAGEQLNVIFRDDIKCITVNGSTMIYVDADCICHVMIILFTQNLLEVLIHSSYTFMPSGSIIYRMEGNFGGRKIWRIVC